MHHYGVSSSDQWICHLYCETFVLGFLIKTVLGHVAMVLNHLMFSAWDTVLLSYCAVNEEMYNSTPSMLHCVLLIWVSCYSTVLHKGKQWT